jgi:hypothetical protein
MWAGQSGAVAARNSLAVICLRTGRTGDALAHAEAAVRIGEQALGPAHPLLVRPLANLASLHQLAGRDGEAECAFHRALTIAGSVSGPDHPLVTSVLRERALALRKTGHPEQARPLEQRAGAATARPRRNTEPDYTVDVSEFPVEPGARQRR